MTLRARRPYRRLWRKGVLVLGLLAIALGLWQFKPPPTGLGDPVQWFNAGLRTLQLFVLQTTPEELTTWWGRWAAILAPLSTAGALVAAFGERVYQRWLLTQLLWAPPTDAFIGGGGTAAGVAVRRARAQGRPVKVIGLDQQADSPLAHAIAALDLPGFMRVGDALSFDDLAELRLHRVRNVWVGCGDELRNIEIARRVCALLAARRDRPSVPVRLFVQISDRQLVRAREQLFPALDPEVVGLELYSMQRLAARTLLHRHPPCPGPGQTAPHILIVGNGPLAHALALHAMQHAVFAEAPQAALRITVAGTGSAGLRAQLCQQFAALKDSGDPHLQALLPLAHIEALEADEAELGPRDWLAAQQGGRVPFSAVYVSCANDAFTLNAALRAAALREIAETPGGRPLPIVACMHQVPGAEGSLTGAAQPEPGQALHGIRDLALFRVYDACIHPDEDYPGERQDRRALLVHAAYRGVLAPASAPAVVDDAVRRRWIAEAMALWRQEIGKGAYRWSSRLCADHIDVKMALLALQPGALAADATGGQPLAAALQECFKDERLVHALARLEHRRFVVERLLEGWLPLPPQHRGADRGVSGLGARAQKEHLLLNHTLVPFERLAEVDPDTDQFAKDIGIVRAIPEILRCERLMNAASGLSS